MIRLLLLFALLLAGPVRAADVSGLDWVQRPGGAVPMEAPLVDAAGRATTLRRVAGGLPLVVAPGYFQCPNLCGVVRDDLFAALGASGLQAGRDYVAVLLTIDPAENPADAAQAAAGVADRYPGMAFQALTGPAGSLGAIAGAVGFSARFDAGSKQFLHPAGVVFVSPGGLVSGYAMGLGYGAAAIEAAVALARAEGSTAAEPVHLFCFSYDPATGRVSLAAMEAVRLVSAVSVLGIGCFLFVLYRRP